MMQESLFTQTDMEPLASRMRPERLEDIAGQQHLLGEGKILRRMIASDRLPSMIFWGPPGVGKTTLAPGHRQPDALGVHQFQRGIQRHQGD